MLVAVAVEGASYYFDKELRDRGLLVGFFTRLGGPGPALADLGLSYGDRFTRAKQVHGHRVHFVKQADAGAGSRPSVPRVPAADALVTDLAGTPLVISTADCAPILLVDPEARIVGAAHAGWRGTFDRIVAGTVDVMAQAGADPGRIRARIGPTIGPCCYNVGQDLQARFAARFGLSTAGSEPQLDLVAINEGILRDCGVDPGHIESLDLCTACNPELFYSWRRSAETGRLESIIAIGTGTATGT